jgi:hypothetical protein
VVNAFIPFLKFPYHLVYVYVVVHKINRGVVPGGAGDAMTPPDFGRQLTLSQPGGADYAHHITTGTPGFSDLPTYAPTALQCVTYTL